VDLHPVTVDSWEAGFRGLAGARLVYQVSAYDMTIRDDIVTYTTESNGREARNAGRTQHRGVEASAGLALTSALRLDVAWSVSRQRYVDWTPQAARPTDPANTHFYGGYDQVNLRVSTPITPRAELFARVVNLTDRKYAELLSYDNFLKEQYTPGAPRSVVLGMRVGR
jgi:outer membrane cobalamin receptor